MFMKNYATRRTLIDRNYCQDKDKSRASQKFDLKNMLRIIAELA